MDGSAVDGDLVLALDPTSTTGINACLMETLILDLPLSQSKCKSQAGHILEASTLYRGFLLICTSRHYFPTRAAVRCGPLLCGFSLNNGVLLRTVSEILGYQKTSSFEQAALQLLVIFGHAQSGFSILDPLRHFTSTNHSFCASNRCDESSRCSTNAEAGRWFSKVLQYMARR